MSATPPPPDWHDWLAASETRSRRVQAEILHDLADDVAAGRVQLVYAEVAQNRHLPNDPVLLRLHFEVPPRQEE